jgi:hypothetical protein
MRTLWIALGALAATALLVLFAMLLLSRSLAPEASPPPPTQAPEPAKQEPKLPSEPRPVDPYAGEIRVAAGDTIVLRKAMLEPGKPVVLSLDLGEPSQTGEPRPARLLGPKGPIKATEATLDAARTGARFVIDPASLTGPGRYIVEVQTTERSHFPIRRYAIQLE